jgi:hypothetical protein
MRGISGRFSGDQRTTSLRQHTIAKTLRKEVCGHDEAFAGNSAYARTPLRGLSSLGKRTNTVGISASAD